MVLVVLTTAFSEYVLQAVIGLAPHHADLISLAVRLFTALVISVPVALYFGDMAGALAASRDEARHDARVDAVTGLPNGRAFDEAVSDGAAPATFAIVELDGFGAIRSHGRRMTDAAVRAVAKDLQAAIAYGELYRSGPKRFVWLARQTEQRAAFETLERVRAAISRQPLDLDGRVLPLTISAGIADGRDADSDLAQIAAERALFKAKHGGCNQIRLDYGDGASAYDLGWSDPPHASAA